MSITIFKLILLLIMDLQRSSSLWMMPLLGVTAIRLTKPVSTSWPLHPLLLSASRSAFLYRLVSVTKYNLRVVKLNELLPLWFALGHSFIATIEILIKTPWVTEVTILRIVQKFYLLCIPSSQWPSVTSKAFKSPAP